MLIWTIRELSVKDQIFAGSNRICTSKLTSARRTCSSISVPTSQNIYKPGASVCSAFRNTSPRYIHVRPVDVSRNLPLRPQQKAQWRRRNTHSFDLSSIAPTLPHARPRALSFITPIRGELCALARTGAVAIYSSSARLCKLCEK